MSAEIPLMLSVSGLRGIVGRTLVPSVASRYTAAFGQWLSQNKPRADHNAPHVIIGRDSRPSGQMLEMAAAAGLISAGCRVTCLGIVTTPTVGVMIDHLKADGGVVITASHNPGPWNGVKLLRHDCVAPSPDQVNQIIERFKADQIQYVAFDRIQPVSSDSTANDVHCRRVLELLDVPAIRKRKVKVVLESVHGAGGPAGAQLLNALGVELIHLYAEPTGQFPHQPEPTRENLTGLCDAVRQHGADLGFAQDPDADRLAIVDDQGNYIGEEYTLVLAVLEVLSRTTNPGAATVVANLSTSRMIDDVAAKFGARVLRTPVGEANVAAAMIKENAVIGGEGNGGVVWPKVVLIRDSIAGMGLVLQLLVRMNLPLSKIIKTIPSYAIIKEKIDIKPGIAERLAPTLKQAYAGQKIDTQDGVRIDWPDGWVHVRTSNTEPIIRFVSEARDEAKARQLIGELRACLSEKLALT